MFFELLVFRDRTRLSTVGKSSGHGFRVGIRHRRLNLRADEALPGFREDSNDSTAVALTSFVGYIGGLVLWSFLAAALVGGAEAATNNSRALSMLEHMSIFVGGIAAGTLCSIIPTVLARGKTVWQWHACEHKAILMLRQGMEPTMENLRRMPASTPSCGSVRVFLVCALAMAFSLIQAFPIGAWLAFTSIIAGLFCTLFLAGTGQRSWSLGKRLFYVIGLPAILVGVTFEWLVVLRTPTEAQLEQTLNFLHKLYWRHPWLASPKLRRTPTLQRILG